jgi:hypothetical protein
MSDEKKAPRDVFGFLVHQYEERPGLPSLCAVKRTQESKYQFLMVARHYRQALKKKPQFFQYSRAEASSLKAQMEEH